MVLLPKVLVIYFNRFWVLKKMCLNQRIKHPCRGLFSESCIITDLALYETFTVLFSKGFPWHLKAIYHFYRLLVPYNLSPVTALLHCLLLWPIFLHYDGQCQCRSLECPSNVFFISSIVPCFCCNAQIHHSSRKTLGQEECWKIWILLIF